MVKLFCAIVGVAGSVFSVRVDEDDSVDDLKDAIKAKNATTITGDAKDLQLFLAKKDDRWLPDDDTLDAVLQSGDDTSYVKMRASWKLNKPSLFGPNVSLGEDVIHVLVVVPGDLNQVAKDTRSARTHSEHRRKRWRELNEILDKNKKAKTNGDDGSSTGYSYVRWSEVKSVLDYERYKQERKPIPDHAFDFLIKYLKYAAEAMNGYTDASREAKRYHFIAPVLIMLCSLFVDVKLEVEESVDGNEVHANGNFEFVLTRGKTKICIVEAKNNDFDQGKAQALIGCEAVADREGLYVVYGIVTDFMKWQLYRCGENSILLDSSTLSAKSEELDTGSMRDVCEMIYGALSDHEEECKKEQLCIE
ncbi:hypothetical protein PC110_g21075 [Phytophthora cactorum]|uniref:Crinkler effector protein N-terminal domain-containing protein n=2 Tax=Phytophthora cactorum TaxID=29920 RepID=A0A329RDA0_9STRA|nr:hypothetical protein PC119_g26503 [Phytophthora cactorum]RAW22484.1 hypothetical protein PC110_g21075 [Phytophthora cactorum]